MLWRKWVKILRLRTFVRIARVISILNLNSRVNCRVLKMSSTMPNQLSWTSLSKLRNRMNRLRTINSKRNNKCKRLMSWWIRMRRLQKFNRSISAKKVIRSINNLQPTSTSTPSGKKWRFFSFVSQRASINSDRKKFASKLKKAIRFRLGSAVGIWKLMISLNNTRNRKWRNWPKMTW